MDLVREYVKMQQEKKKKDPVIIYENVKQDILSYYGELKIRIKNNLT